MPLAAVDVLVPVVTAGRGRDDALGRLADRLGAGDPGRRLRAPALRLPDPARSRSVTTARAPSAAQRANSHWGNSARGSRTRTRTGTGAQDARQCPEHG